jgi:predicted nuclease with TOPRIM domain
LLKRHSDLQEQLQRMKDKMEAQTLQDRCKGAYSTDTVNHTDLMKRNSELQTQLKAMKDTVEALNSQLNISCKEAHDSKTTLMKQCNSLKETVEALNSQLSLSCKAAEDKLLLQSQLHSDKLRLLEVTHNTLRERCKTIAVSAEQHRVANITLEERHKSMTKDMELLADGQMSGVTKEIQKHRSNASHMQSIISTKDKEISQLQLLLSTNERDISHLKSLVSTKDGDISRLQSQATAK